MSNFEQNMLAFKASVTAFVGVITSIFGWTAWLLLLWMCSMFGDYITGTAAAMRKGKWDSSVARDGLWHKAGMICAVSVAGAGDLLVRLMLNVAPTISLPFDYNAPLLALVLVWYIITELGSIVENAVAMGASVPAFLTKFLSRAKDTVEGDSDGE